jgi:hypothetical protein
MKDFMVGLCVGGLIDGAGLVLHRRRMGTTAPAAAGEPAQPVAKPQLPARFGDPSLRLAQGAPSPDKFRRQNRQPRRDDRQPRPGQNEKRDADQENRSACERDEEFSDRL